MCEWVTVIKRDGSATVATTKGELRDALGIEPVLDSRCTFPDWSDDSCLCPCDVEATANAAGLTAERDECAEWLLSPNAALRGREAVPLESTVRGES